MPILSSIKENKHILLTKALIVIVENLYTLMS